MSDGKREYSVDQAAKRLGIGSKTLFKRLRATGVFNSSNVARHDLVIDGHFRTVTKDYPKEVGNTVLRIPYRKTLVTETGLDFIKRMLEDQEKKDADTKQHAAIH